jgi:Sec-independent protein translocase protein TatA
MNRTLGATAQQALGREPGKALAAIRRLRQELEAVEAEQVADALSRGWTWARIGRALGVSRQAVHRKYHHATPTPLAWSGPEVSSGLRVVLVIARSEAAARGDVMSGTEHLLLGLLQHGDSRAADALRTAGASLRALRSAVDVLAPSDLSQLKPSDTSFTRRATKAVERATYLAHGDGAERVTEEHLLHALLESPGCGALAVLQATGVPSERVEAALAASAVETDGRGDGALTPSPRSYPRS